MNDDRRRRLVDANDAALAPLIEADDEPSMDAALTELLASRAQPLVARVLRQYRRRDPLLTAEDLDDVAGVTMLRLVPKLESAARSEEEAIASLDDYVAAVTYNEIHAALRRRHPERARLKRRLRYLFTRDPRFALWNTDDGLVCGMREWIGGKGADLAIDAGHVDDRMGDALYAALRGAGRPVLLDAVVRACAERWNIAEPARVRDDLSVPPPQLAALETRERLQSIWNEVTALRPLQRAALLLHMRDGDGLSAAGLFVFVGAASLADIAAALSITPPQLHDLWPALPLDDRTIAARLGVTRQQVINLRQAARQRLARRLVYGSQTGSRTGS